MAEEFLTLMADLDEDTFFLPVRKEMKDSMEIATVKLQG